MAVPEEELIWPRKGSAVGLVTTSTAITGSLGPARHDERRRRIATGPRRAAWSARQTAAINGRRGIRGCSSRRSSTQRRGYRGYPGTAAGPGRCSFQAAQPDRRSPAAARRAVKSVGRFRGWVLIAVGGGKAAACTPPVFMLFLDGPAHRVDLAGLDARARRAGPVRPRRSSSRSRRAAIEDAAALFTSTPVTSACAAVLHVEFAADAAQ